MATSDNPFAPPKAAVLEADSDDTFIAGGRKVPGGRGTKWIGEAWELYKKSPGVWIGIFLIYIIITFVLAILGVGSIISSVLYPVFTAGIMLGCRALEKGEPLEVAHFFAGFKQNVSPLILVGLLYLAGSFVIVLIAIAVGLAMIPLFGGAAIFTGNVDPATMAGVLLPAILLFALVILALTLPLVMALWFAPPLVLFNNLGPWEAMKASFSGCLRNFWPFFIYGVVFLLLFIVAMIPLGLGILVVGPMVWGSIYTAYRDIYTGQD